MKDSQIVMALCLGALVFGLFLYFKRVKGMKSCALETPVKQPGYMPDPALNDPTMMY